MEYHGPLFRALHPAYARDPLSGEGARRYGGRFNRKGRAALYLACDFDTLRYEIARGGAFQPSVVVEFDAAVSALADARDPAVLARFGMDAGVLADPAWRLKMLQGDPVPTQDFAEALTEAGFAGLAVPSFAKGAGSARVNIVLWAWRDDPRVQLTLVDDEGRLG